MNLLIKRALAPLTATLLLSACSAPVLQQPVIDTPVAFKEATLAAEVRTAADGSRWQQAQPAEQQQRGEWWRAFHDEALNQLINEAATNNANLAVALARLKQARALAGIAEADRAPQLDVSAGTQRARSSPAELGLPSSSTVAHRTVYSARLTASYEVDLFGRVASGVAAARGDAAASHAMYQSVLLALQADVAQHYFRLRATDAELVTLAQTVHLRDESVRVNQRRFELGDIGEFDLARARTELSTVRAEAVGLQRERATTEHALAVLLGKPPAAFNSAPSPLSDSALLPNVPAGLPSALLQRRPDVTAAQRVMEAANARIGVARAAMFPALNIGASGGGVAGTVSNVLSMSSRSWMMGALLSAPLFDGGRNRANVVRSEAGLEEAVGQYRQSILVAFSEVEDNLAGLRVLSEQTREIDDALVSARRSAELAQKLYEAGRSSYLELLDAQRNLAAVERQAVQLRGNRALTTVALIRSLGGSWEAFPPAA